MSPTQKHEVDTNSQTWRAIERWIEERLQLRRHTLQSCGLPMDETENARGAIEELSELRDLAKPRLVSDDASDSMLAEL